MDAMSIFMISYLLDSFIIFTYCMRINRKSHITLIYKMIWCVLLYVFMFGSVSPNIGMLNMVLFLMINFVYLLLVTNNMIMDSSIYLLFIIATMSVSMAVPFSIVNYTLINQLACVDMNVIISIIVCKILYGCTIVFFASKVTDSVDDYVKVDIRFKILSVSAMVVSMLISFALMLICFLNNQKEVGIVATLSALFIVLLDIVVFIICYFAKCDFDHKIEQEIFMHEEDINRCNMELNRISEEQKILIHDIKNHLLVIEGLSKKKENQELQDYIKKIIGTSELAAQQSYSSNATLNAIILRYAMRAQNESVDFSINISEGVLYKIEATDVTALLCNLLDNAFEAIEKLNRKNINLLISKKENTAYSIISVTNTCEKNPFTELNKLNTGKKNPSNHGYGIRSIERVAKKYDGHVEKYYDSEYNEFHFVVLVEEK